MICVASNTYARRKIGGRVWGVVEVGKLISVVTGSLKNGISVYETLWTGQVRQGAIYTSQAVQDPVQPFIRGICAGESLGICRRDLTWVNYQSATQILD